MLYGDGVYVNKMIKDMEKLKNLKRFPMNKVRDINGRFVKGRIVPLKIKKAISHGLYKRYYYDYGIYNITPEFARILGHLLGDGGIGNGSTHKYRLRYCNSNPILLNSFQEDMFSVFKTKVACIRKKGQGIKGDTFRYDLYYPSSIGRYLIKRFGDIFISHKKRVPKILYKSNKKVMQNFLQAMFDDEGTVSIPSRQITMDLKSYFLLKDIQIMLNKLDIISKIIPYKTTYRLYINGKNNFLNFERINFLSPKKAEKLSFLIEKIKLKQVKRRYIIEGNRTEFMDKHVYPYLEGVN